MQESIIAKQLLQEALTRAALMGADQIFSVKGWVCDPDELSEEKLKNHFKTYAKGTPAEGARLTLETKRAKLRCFSCGQISEPIESREICPLCGDERIEFLERVGVTLDRIEVA
jgi:Zn finger protein HypA/HybF involved in hydrogenase expression